MKLFYRVTKPAVYGRFSHSSPIRSSSHPLLTNLGPFPADPVLDAPFTVPLDGMEDGTPATDDCDIFLPKQPRAGSFSIERLFGPKTPHSTIARGALPLPSTDEPLLECGDQSTVDMDEERWAVVEAAASGPLAAADDELELVTDVDDDEHEDDILVHRRKAATLELSALHSAPKRKEGKNGSGPRGDEAIETLEEGIVGEALTSPTK